MWLAKNSGGKKWLFNNEPFKITSPVTKEFSWVTSDQITGIPVKANISIGRFPVEVILEIKKV